MNIDNKTIKLHGEYSNDKYYTSTKNNTNKSIISFYRRVYP